MIASTLEGCVWQASEKQVAAMSLKSLETPDPKRMGQRGEKRYALIMAGLQLFGKHGLEATTTRMLAETSGANVAAIPYYFGSKEGLYRAVMAYILDRIDDHVGDTFTKLQTMQQEAPLSREQALASYKALMTTLAGIMVESDEPKAWAQIIMREQANPTEAYEIFHRRHMKRTLQASHQLVGVITGLDPKSLEVKMRTHAMLGQILGFLVSRETLLRSLNVKKLNKTHLQVMHKVLTNNIDACLLKPID
jgi:AcrR family transcriptional regulator